MSDNVKRTLAILSLSALFGGMIFFGAIMAPLVFTKLPPTIADGFIRATFPRYYAYVTVTSALSALFLALRHTRTQSLIAPALTAIAIAAVTLFMWLVWLPHLDTLRAAHNHAAFARGHTISVWINAIQLLAALALLIRATLPARTTP